MLLSGVPGVDADHTLAVFVDPYTAKVEAPLEQYGATGALPLRTWIDELHRDLHLGETGRLYSELAASWLWVIASGGLVLWFSRRRALRLLRGTTGRRRTLGLHGTVGAWAAAGFPVPLGDRPDLVRVRRGEHRRTAHLARRRHPGGRGDGGRRPRRARRRGALRPLGGPRPASAWTRCWPRRAPRG
ncbi:hypothetical protein SGLAM104S_07749 [Streptomyces glaucescens]